MLHNTKKNCIFVDIEVGNRSLSFHIEDFKIHLQINKIVT